MKFRYNHEKNAKLLLGRKVGFEEIITEITNGNLIRITPHHNQRLYHNQQILYVRRLDQIYLVLCVEEEGGCLFLKTLYSSRKMTKQLLGQVKNKKQPNYHELA